MINIIVAGIFLYGWLSFSRKYKTLPPQLTFIALAFLLILAGVGLNFLSLDLSGINKYEFWKNFSSVSQIFIPIVLIMIFVKDSWILKPKQFHHILREMKRNLKPTFWITFLLYPLFGIVQQFFVFAFLLPGVTKTFGLSSFTIILTAAFFAMLHYPNRTLTVIAFLGELMAINFYLIFPNIISLGIWHGIFGTILYYMVIGDDVWERKVKIKPSFLFFKRLFSFQS